MDVTSTVERLIGRFDKNTYYIEVFFEGEVDLDTGEVLKGKKDFEVRGLLKSINSELQNRGNRPGREYGGFFNLENSQLIITRDNTPCWFDPRKQNIKVTKDKGKMEERSWKVSPRESFFDENIISLILVGSENEQD